MQKDNTNESSRSARDIDHVPPGIAAPRGTQKGNLAETSTERACPAAGSSSPPAASIESATPASEKTLDRMTIIVGDMIGQWNRNRVRRGHTAFASTASCDALAKEIIHFILGNKP